LAAAARPDGLFLAHYLRRMPYRALPAAARAPPFARYRARHLHACRHFGIAMVSAWAAVAFATV